MILKQCVSVILDGYTMVFDGSSPFSARPIPGWCLRCPHTPKVCGLRQGRRQIVVDEWRRGRGGGKNFKRQKRPALMVRIQRGGQVRAILQRWTERPRLGLLNRTPVAMFRHDQRRENNLIRNIA